MKHTGTVGYAAMFEQFHPTDLLEWIAKSPRRSGFGSVMASDHFHPWTPDQGQSAFVWSWLGALGATTNLRFGTGVTPPGFRYHPAIIAQAAATLEAMYPGRFWLGLGAGEALNEHVVGEYWPEAPTRLRILMESIEVINKLFSGKVVKYQGDHIKLESAKLYTMPDTPPPVYVATAGPICRASARAGEFCDGIITVGRAGRQDTDAHGEVRRGRPWKTKTRPDAAHDPTARLIRRKPGRGRTTTPSKSGPTAACRSPKATSATPKTSPRWRSR